jgi:hypothetical protein
MSYREKYIKYKTKYLNLVAQYGGDLNADVLANQSNRIKILDALKKYGLLY